MFHPSEIHPDVELRNYLKDKISVVVSGSTTKKVTVYGDWERPTNGLEDDFIVIMLNGDFGGVGMDTPFARGFLMVSLYCRLNDDGSVKKNRVEKILKQFDTLVDNKSTDHYFFKYDPQQFITPTTPNITSGYSVTTLNLRWTTNSNFNKPLTP